MPRGLFAGSTDYSQQTFQDILDDLNNWKMSLISSTETIGKMVRHLQDNGYWDRVPDDFSLLVMYALKFYETSITEISGISQELQIEVQENHISRLRSLAQTAHKLNLDFGQVWHREYDLKDYGEPNFAKVEKIYALGRDMVVDMLDLSNAAARLEDYVGMKSEASKQRNIKKYIMSGLLFLLGIIISIVTNVASSALPSSFQPQPHVEAQVLAGDSQGHPGVEHRDQRDPSLEGQFRPGPARRPDAGGRIRPGRTPDSLRSPRPQPPQCDRQLCALLILCRAAFT